MTTHDQRSPSKRRSQANEQRQTPLVEQRWQQETEIERLPRDPKSGKAIAPRAQPGYYPGFSTMSQQAFWDEATRAVVRERVEQVPPITFFTETEARVLKAVCDNVLPQDDRLPETRIPIVNAIDARLAAGRINGYQYNDMPPDGEAYRLAIQGIEEMAHSLGASAFAELSLAQQEQALKSMHDGKPLAGEDVWRRVNVRRFWMMLVTDCATAYYSHPGAWDEIGFGGPAYPRGYMRLRNGQPEPWEKIERRYEWEAPPASLSDTYDSLSEAPEAASFTPGTH